MRWLQFRAAINLPALLSRCDEKTIVSLAAAINGGLAIIVIGVFAWLTELPLVFPALGPSAFILFSAPFSPAAAPRSVVLGHLLGMACGWLCWFITSLFAAEPISLAGEGWAPIASACAALAMTAMLLIRFQCPHPPACASALVIALGGVTHWTAIGAMAVAVLIVTVQAVWLSRLFGVKTPLWRAHYSA